MEPKKNPSKDVHRYSHQFFLLGLGISCAIMIMAFAWETEVTKHKPEPPPFPDPPFTLYPVPVVPEQEPPTQKPVREKKVIMDLTQVTEATSTDEPQEEWTTPAPEAPGPIEVVIDMEKDIYKDTFIVVEHKPEPVGGYEGFYKFLRKELKYPTLAKRNHTEGSVFVEFVVNKDGVPANLKVVKGIGSGCDEEALRALSKVRWAPGKQRGHAVSVKMTMAIYFKLQ